MEKVIAVKIVSEQGGLSTRWEEKKKTIVARTLYVMYSDHTWEGFELHYKCTGKYGCGMAYPKSFRSQNITDKKMTKEEVHKYIEEFKKSEES